MPLRPGNRYISVLVLAGVVVSFLAIRANESQQGMAAVLVGIGLLLRQEYSDRKASRSRQNINVKLDDIKETAQTATTSAERAASEVRDAASVLVRQTNGELDAKIIKAVCDALNERLPQAIAFAMQPVAERLSNLDKYVHDWKHDSVQREQSDLLENEIAKRERQQ